MNRIFVWISILGLLITACTPGSQTQMAGIDPTEQPTETSSPTTEDQTATREPSPSPTLIANATHTPQVIAFNSERQIIYRGPIDDSSQHQGRVEHAYLPDQVQRLLDQEADEIQEVPPLGCWLVTKRDLERQ